MRRNINKNDVVIMGDWNGQPIWREKTPGEKLAYKLRDTKLFKGEPSNKLKHNEQRTNNHQTGNSKGK